MKKTLLSCLCMQLAFSSLAQLTYNDKYSYSVETKTFTQIVGAGGGASCAGNRNPTEEQFQSYLTGLGEKGWELISTLAFITSNQPAVGFSTCGKNLLTVTLVLKKAIYNTKSEIEKDVAFYTKKYADSVALVMISEINKMTWSQMGKHYKDDIVNDIIQKMKILMEANKPKGSTN